jgi:transcriptional regulator with XRE-family HTH domain
MARELARALKVLPADSARRIRTALAFHDLRQFHLAKAIESDEATVSRKLHGRRGWSDAERQRVAALFGVPVDLLFPEAA